MSKVVDILMKEHQFIAKVVEAVINEADKLEAGEKINELFFEQAIDFIVNYADKFHHSKEEDILFKTMCSDPGAMHCNPTEQMLYEHKIGRENVLKMKQGLADKNKKMLIEGAYGYGYLLRDHIVKEDSILYPMAEDIVGEKEMKQMAVSFEAVKNNNFSKNYDNKYIKFAQNL